MKIIYLTVLLALELQDLGKTLCSKQVEYAINQSFSSQENMRLKIPYRQIKMQHGISITTRMVNQTKISNFTEEKQKENATFHKQNTKARFESEFKVSMTPRGPRLTRKRTLQRLSSRNMKQYRRQDQDQGPPRYTGRPDNMKRRTEPDEDIQDHQSGMMPKPTKENTEPTWVPPKRLTAPPPVTADHHCDIVWKYCMKAYNTGSVCARTVYYTYNTMDNWCVIDYVNCRERQDIWIGLHMGPCLKVEPLSDYNNYPYQDDYFLDRELVIEEM